MAEHDLIFYEARSTPKVVRKGESPENVPESYGKQTKRRAATEDEEKVIARGDWLRVDESGKKGGEDGYKKTRMKGREHLVHGEIISDTGDLATEAIRRLGLDPDDKGFVGLEIELPAVYKQVLEPEWEYISPVETYVKGYKVNPHITLIYGLLFMAYDHKDLIDGVLKNWYKPNMVVMPEVEAFFSNDGNEAYAAIVLTLGDNEHDLEDLKAANDELRKLPHVNGFPVYKPHITIGYVKDEFAAVAVERLKSVEVRPLRTGELDYGTPGD